MLKKIFSSLKVRLGLGSAALALFIFLEYRLSSAGSSGWAVFMLILALALLAGINYWFYKDVTAPMDKLTQSARHIAEGSYGIQCPKTADDEIGGLTDEINQMSEKIHAFVRAARGLDRA